MEKTIFPSKSVVGATLKPAVLVAVGPQVPVLVITELVSSRAMDCPPKDKEKLPAVLLLTV